MIALLIFSTVLLIVGIIIAAINIEFFNFLHLLAACSPIFIGYFFFFFRPSTLRKKYTIKKGRASSGVYPFLFFQKDEVNFRFNLHESCDFQKVGSHQLMTQRNKIMGLGYFPHHHKNSYRLAWKQMENAKSTMLNLCAYFYRNEYRCPDAPEYDLIPVYKNTWYVCQIKLDYRKIDETKKEPVVIYRIFDDKTKELLCEKIYSREAHNLVGYFLMPFLNDREEGKAPHPVEMSLEYLTFSMDRFL